MNKIGKIVFLLMLTQLSACAVMTKQECLSADWQHVGYNVGLSGKVDISKEFNRRAKTCAKHGSTANWQEFSAGHSDGIVQFCQLDNAVELGVKGARYAINNEVCPDHYYPDFREAFDAGYQLHVLNDRVNESSSAILSAESYIRDYKKRIKRIDKQLRSAGLDNHQVKSLRHERNKLRDDIFYLERDIAQYQRYLYHDKKEQRRYADFLYQEYLFNLSDEFVDPRNHIRQD